MPSTFQTLPDNIIDMVYDTIVKHREWQWPWEVDDDRAVGYSYFPLLSTCKIWRKLGVQRAYGCISISVGAYDNVVKVYYSDLPEKPIEPTHPCLNLAHAVSLLTNFESIISGKALAVLEQSIYAGLVIPTAQKLTIRLSNHKGEENSVPDRTLPFMQEFAAKLKCIVPMMKNINVTCHLAKFKADKVRGELIGRFVRLLYTNKQEFGAVNFNNPTSSLLVPNFTSGITELDTDWDDHYELKVRIAHLNALTLRCLFIRFQHAKDIHTLINSHESYIVVYPNLHFLELQSSTLLQHLVKPTMSKEVVPFPKLQYLFMKMDYPFADDTLFRGNSDTLEFLKIQPDIETMYMMDRCGVFTRTKYRRLRGVRISERLVADAPKDIVARFVLEVSSHAQVLTIEDVTLGREFAMSVIRVKSLDQLQRLNMNNFNLTLCEIINMLRSLPSLTHLVSCEPELGYQFGELEVDDLGEYMLMAYYPLSKTFRSWTCCRLSTSTVDELSLCAILLAIACPRLSCASVGSIKFNEYCECVGEMMSEEPLASYLDLVEPLPQPRE